jgi:hypothetical protein
MAITVYPPPATTSSSAAATTTDSTKYSWGTPKLGVCMQLTSECSNLCLCFCCRDLTAIANGATSCQTVNMSWRVFPFGDNCVVVTVGLLLLKVHAVNFLTGCVSGLVVVLVAVITMAPRPPAAV